MSTDSRIHDLRNTGSEIAVTWKSEFVTRFGAPRPTLDEKLEAIKVADEAGVAWVNFPYPGESIRRCMSCGWITKNAARCWDCVVLEQYAVVFRAEIKRGKPMQQRRLGKAAITALEERCESLSLQFATLAAKLREYGLNSAHTDKVMTADTEMYGCTNHPSSVTVALKPFVPTCYCGMKMTIQ